MTLEELLVALREEGLEVPPERLQLLKAKYRDLDGIEALDKLAEGDDDEG